LGEVFGRQVRLALRVKVKKNWRQRDAVLQAISEPSG
jgi:GTPase Era involved in 16S rRNA processing